MDPRQKMTSGFGLRAIDDHMEAEMERIKQATIATGLTGELTPSGSECGDDNIAASSPSSGELTRTLSALQRLSEEERTNLRRKLGQQLQASRDPDLDKSKAQDDVIAVAADSPYRVVLQKAVVEGDLEAASAALLSGADPNERDDLRHSSLHFAAAKGDIGCVRELMSSGARANVANNVGWSPLHYAVLGGHVAAVEALLCAGAYPCFRDNHLISPLHLASTQAGDRVTFQRIAELLGPSALLARDELEQTPLHVASSCGNRGAVAVLLDLNADPESTDRKGRAPGQSFLRQVSKRARADIRASLAAAVERRSSAAEATAAAAAGGFGDGTGTSPVFVMSALSSAVGVSSGSSATGTGGGGGAGVMASSVLSAMSASGDRYSLATAAAAAAASTKVVMRRAGSTSSYEEAAPVKRPSMLSLLPAWGGNGRGAGGVSEKGGETTFRTAFAVL